MATFPVVRDGGCGCGCEGGLSPCGKCGHLCEITFDVTVPPGVYWELRQFSVGGWPPCECEPGDLWTDVGPVTGLTIFIDMPWWASRCAENPAGCCPIFYAEVEDFETYFQVTQVDCTQHPGGFIQVTAHHPYCEEPAWEVEIIPDGWGCYHCNRDGVFYDHHGGDLMYSDCTPDFTVHLAHSENKSCLINGCTFNFTNGTQVFLVYDRYIDPCACTQETTGWVHGLTVPIPYCPVTYGIDGRIDGNVLDGHTITVWGSFSLTFGIDNPAGANAYHGRYHVRIYGVACDDSETLVADYMAGSWVITENEYCGPQNHTNEITPGGLYGPWTPDPLAEYQAYRIQVDLEPWDRVRLAGYYFDPVAGPIHAASPMVTQSFIVHVDPGLFSCP